MSGARMDVFGLIFGYDDELNVLHMTVRAVLISAYCLGLLRFSGRRSMALGTPIDNVYAILIGAVLSRAITGASPFVPTVAAAFMIAFIHRFVSYLGLNHKRLGRIVKGEAKVVYRNGQFNAKNLKYCRMSMRDLMAGVRQSSGLDRLDNVKTIYVERNGRISVIKKDN